MCTTRRAMIYSRIVTRQFPKASFFDRITNLYKTHVVVEFMKTYGKPNLVNTTNLQILNLRSCFVQSSLKFVLTF